MDENIRMTTVQCVDFSKEQCVQKKPSSGHFLIISLSSHIWHRVTIVELRLCIQFLVTRFTNGEFYTSRYS